jgi:hypothetical protein
MTAILTGFAAATSASLRCGVLKKIIVKGGEELGDVEIKNEEE